MEINNNFDLSPIISPKSPPSTNFFSPKGTFSIKKLHFNDKTIEKTHTTTNESFSIDQKFGKNQFLSFYRKYISIDLYIFF